MMNKFLTLVFLTQSSHALADCTLPQQANDIDILIIGETHGSKEQVEYAACILEKISTDNETALAIEMIPQKYRLRLVDWVNIYENADKMAIDIEWWKSGWPSWTIYRPLLTQAYDLKLDIIPTDDLTPLPLNIIKESWGSDYQNTYDAWASIINDYHQNNIEPQKLDDLIQLQMSRDINISQAIKEFKQNNPNTKIVFYTGQDHARNRGSIKDLLKPYSSYTIAQNCPKLGHQFDFNTQNCKENGE